MAGLLPAPAVTRLLSSVVRRSVRTGLAGVWLRGPLPPAGGAVLAPSHQSWWDGYLLRELCLECGQEFHVLMDSAQLGRFPYLRRIGALPERSLRPALRALQGGTWLVVFPEGRLSHPGPPGPLRPGAGWLARKAGVPLVPVAVRVALRGQQLPEAYLRCGPAVQPEGLAEALDGLVARQDAELREGDPERPPAGYLRLSGGRRSQSERLDLPGRLLGWLSGERT